jgi:hypothetical protein
MRFNQTRRILKTKVAGNQTRKSITGGNACEMFYEGSELNSTTSSYLPQSLLTPSAFDKDFSDIHVEKWKEVMKLIQEKNGDNLLIVSLGEDMEKNKRVKGTTLLEDILREPTKGIFHTYIQTNPSPFLFLNVFPSDKPSFTYRDSGNFTDTEHTNPFLTFDGSFPLTPIYGPHPSFSRGNTQKNAPFHKNRNEIIRNIRKYGFGNMAEIVFLPRLRRFLFSNVIKILHLFIQYNGPLVIDSSINNLCYRSLLYISEKRHELGKQTHIICGYTTGYRPVREYSPSGLFPRPFEKCKNYIKQQNTFMKYYYPPRPSKAKNPSIERTNGEYTNLVVPANRYANNLLASTWNLPEKNE